MNKKEYMNRLEEELITVPTEYRREIVDSFAEHFAEGEARGLSEEQIIEELGDLEEILASIKAGMKNSDVNDDKTDDPSIHAEAKPTNDGMDPEQKEGQEYAGPRPRVSCLVLEAMDTSTDVHLRSGEELVWKMEPKNGITVGNGFFIHSRFFAPKKEAEVSIDQSDEEYRIAVHGGGGDLFVTVPESIEEIRANISSGDFEMDGICTDRVNVRCQSGDASARNGKINSLWLESKSGDLKTINLETDETRMITVSGDIETDNLTGKVKLKTASGDITIEEHTPGHVREQRDENAGRERQVDGPHADGQQAGFGNRDNHKKDSVQNDITAESKSGDVKVKSEGNVFARSISGDVELSISDKAEKVEAASVSGNTRCRIDGNDYTAILTAVSGELKNKTDRLGLQTGRELKIGNGRMQVQLKSVSGDVILL